MRNYRDTVTPSLTRSGTPRKMRNHREASAYIAKLVPFRSGNFDADTYARHGFGYLPDVWQKEFTADNAPDGPGVDYVVYSYSTPIAWHTVGKGWTVPTVSYSSTTATKHMGPLWTGVYRSEEPVRRRIDAVTVTAAKRLKNSVNGNPRWDVTLSDGTMALTSSDASVSYDVENALRDSQPRFVNYTAAGRIASWDAVPEGGYAPYAVPRYLMGA